MRRTIWVTAVLVLTGYAASAAEPKAIELSRRILTRENARLKKDIQAKKAFMARARMTRAGAMKYKHSIARMESTIATHDLILKQGRAELQVTSARAVVHGDLERHFAAQTKRPPRPDKNGTKAENALLAELKVLKAWRSKAPENDSK